jgi:exosortase E/protease (VPEID-CTERM system)
VRIHSRKALLAVSQGMTLHARLAVLAGLLLVEKAFLNLFVDFASAQQAEGVGALVRVVQHWGFRFLVAFAIAAAAFAYLRGGHALKEVDQGARSEPVRPGLLVLHAIFLVLLIPLSMLLYGRAPILPFVLVVSLWLLLATLAVFALFAALAPFRVWQQAAQAFGSLWGYAGVAAAGAVAAMGWTQRLWLETARGTFECVSRLLAWLIPTLQLDPANRVIDTGRFAVSIDPVCSGLEGMGLMLAFCAVLLVLFRRDYVFPRALILIPLALALSFALNVLRIAALVLIGDAGYPGVAVYGFHSQAGWIAFNAAAVGMALVSLRTGWLTHKRTEQPQVGSENPTAVYLLPLLALLLAGMVSRAASGGFENLYWLRLAAGAAAFVYSLPRLRSLDWRFTWRAVVGGTVAFAIWWGMARLLIGPGGMPDALAALPVPARVAWLTAHLIVSLGVVPIAYELAFRGYLLRRLCAVDFESVSPRSAGAWALIGSAVAFGLCYGTFWLAGTLAGLVFGFVFIRTGRIGEAVAAHATANALIALCVIAGSQWQLWGI